LSPENISSHWIPFEIFLLKISRKFLQISFSLSLSLFVWARNCLYLLAKRAPPAKPKTLPNPNFIHEVHAVAINHQMAVMQAQVGENCTRGCLPDRMFWRTKDGEEEDTHLFVEHEEDSEAKHIYIYQGIVDQPICNCMLFSQLALKFIWFWEIKREFGQYLCNNSRDFQNFDYLCTINNYLKCPLGCIWTDWLLHHQFRFKTPRVKGLGNLKWEQEQLQPCSVSCLAFLHMMLRLVNSTAKPNTCCWLAR